MTGPSLLQPCAILRLRPATLVLASVVGMLALLSRSAVAASPPTWGTAQELQDAINEKFVFRRTNWDGALVNETHPQLKLEKIWWSNKPRTIELTVFTQLSLDRISAMFNQCASYQGPFSAAIYLAMTQHDHNGNLSKENMDRVKQTSQMLDLIVQRVEERKDMCQLDLMFFWEVFDSQEAKMLYPVNYLRNYARMQVRTNALAMIDVDMFISSTLSEELSRPGAVKVYEDFCAKKRTVVLPAFETMQRTEIGQYWARELVRTTKDALKTKQDIEVRQFQLKGYPPGHTPTNYTRWFDSKELYQVTYAKGYEPWFIYCWDNMPWYDVRFRGYGGNKLIVTATLLYMDTTFWIHPGAWIIHNPHDFSDIKVMHEKERVKQEVERQALPTNSLRTTTYRRYGKIVRAMKAGNYTPIVDPNMMRVFDKLQWLKRPPKLKGTAKTVPW